MVRQSVPPVQWQIVLPVWFNFRSFTLGSRSRAETSGTDSRNLNRWQVIGETFALTPTLSPEERETHSPRLVVTNAVG